MAVVVLAGAKLFGCTTDSLKIERFCIEQTDDKDLWLDISSINDAPSSNRAYASCGGRVRTSLGGGASPRMYVALHQLMQRMERDERRVEFGEQGDLFGAYPHKPRKYIERHLDDDHGYFGMEILADGRVRLRCRPTHEKEALGQRDVEVYLLPTTPFQNTYASMPGLWKAIAKDNKHLRAFRGYHC